MQKQNRKAQRWTCSAEHLGYQAGKGVPPSISPSASSWRAIVPLLAAGLNQEAKPTAHVQWTMQPNLCGSMARRLSRSLLLSSPLDMVYDDPEEARAHKTTNNCNNKQKTERNSTQQHEQPCGQNRSKQPPSNAMRAGMVYSG